VALIDFLQFYKTNLLFSYPKTKHFKNILVEATGSYKNQTTSKVFHYEFKDLYSLAEISLARVPVDVQKR
jgi:hypothetical protein